MHKKLSEAKDEVNEVRVDSIKEVLSKLQRIIYYPSKYKEFKFEENEKIIDIVERILYFNQLNQPGQGLKILAPSQMLSRLPISLAQLKAGNNSEKLKTKLGNYCILCTDQKDTYLQKRYINVWLTLLKHGNNLYEQ